MSYKVTIYEEKLKELCDNEAYNLADREFKHICKKYNIKINRHNGNEIAMGPKRDLDALTIRKRRRSCSN